MASHQGSIACRTIPSGSVTLTAVTYAVDGQLHHTVISGKKTYSPSLPDEGIYIIYQDRALQIAAPSCDRRQCNQSHICYCSDSLITRNHIGCYVKQKSGFPPRKPCWDCLVNWLRLYEAAGRADALGMKFLQFPRTLSWAAFPGLAGFYYDTDLDGPRVRSMHNGRHTASANAHSRQSLAFQWIQDTWTEFLRRGTYKFENVTCLANDEFDDGGPKNERMDCADGNLDDGSCSDSDWDDLDMPCRAKRSKRDGDEFDLFNDLIVEEFPKLKNYIRVCSGSSSRLDLTGTANPASNDTNDAPAPIIIPPKGMAVGRTLGRTVVLSAPSGQTRPRRQSSLSVVKARCAKSRSAPKGHWNLLGFYLTLYDHYIVIFTGKAADCWALGVSNDKENLIVTYGDRNTTHTTNHSFRNHAHVSQNLISRIFHRDLPSTGTKQVFEGTTEEAGRQGL
ncbi:hypothetical protein F5B20DRAFT_586620 [Whalleya microplaca]|nr:hypothetical protein F5B20DRAFT_586620 [Whalleya microplaca]